MILTRLRLTYPGLPQYRVFCLDRDSPWVIVLYCRSDGDVYSVGQFPVRDLGGELVSALHYGGCALEVIEA